MDTKTSFTDPEIRGGTSSWHFYWVFLERSNTGYLRKWIMGISTMSLSELPARTMDQLEDSYTYDIRLVI